MTSHPSESLQLTRAQLYDKLWTASQKTIIEELGVTRAELLNICNRHDIPRPPVGYWSQVAYGTVPGRAPLPASPEQAIIVFKERHEPRPRLASNKSQPVVVPDKLRKAHRLIDETGRYLRQVTQASNGILTPNQDCLQISVTKSSLNRALRIYDTMIRHWESLGGSVLVGEAAPNDAAVTSFEFQGDSVWLELSETLRRSERPGQKLRALRYREYNYHPTGRLSVVLRPCFRSRSTWNDTVRQRLETCIESIASGILTAIERTRRERLDDECLERQRTWLKQVRSATVRHRKKERQRRKSLVADAKNWRRSQQIREYLSELTSRSAAGTLPQVKHVSEVWLNWARWYADYCDPFTEESSGPGRVVVHKTVSVGDLDLTHECRDALVTLAVTDTDELYALDREALIDMRPRTHNEIWFEVNRVLGICGYDLRGRNLEYRW